MRPVPHLLPIGKRLPVEFGRLIALDLDSSRASFKPRLATEVRGTADLQSLPLPMLCHADHVADHFGGGQTRDQPIFHDLEGEILAPFICVKPRLSVCSIFSKHICHHIIFATDTVREPIVRDRRGG